MSKQLLLAHPRFRVPATNCPTCSYRMDRARAADGGERQPADGDFSVCINCGELLRFNADLTLRALNEADFREAPAELFEARKMVLHLGPRRSA